MILPVGPFWPAHSILSLRTFEWAPAAGGEASPVQYRRCPRFSPGQLESSCAGA